MTTSPLNHYHVRFKAQVNIDEEVYDISGFEITYERNAIPSAMFFLNVGREPLTGEGPGGTSALLRVEPYTEMTINIRAETELDHAEGEMYPGFPFGEDVMIFRGFFTGAGYQTLRTPGSGSVALVGHATGWLAGLGGTSASANLTTVKGPGGFDEIATLQPQENKVALLDLQGAIQYAGAEGVNTDLWVSILEPMMRAIANQPSTWGDSENDWALDALLAFDSEGFVGNTRLALRISDTEAPFAAKFIGTHIAKAFYEDWRRTDLWSAFMQLGTAFHFSLVPTIHHAYPVPFYGPLHYPVFADAYRVIQSRDYYQLRLSPRTPIKVTKAAIVDSQGSISSAFDADVRLGGLVGFFDAGAEWGIAGQTAAIEAPAWLKSEATFGNFTRFSLGGTEMSPPDAVNPAIQPALPDESYAELYNRHFQTDLGDRYAQAVVQEAQLFGREGTVTGRFRLDIAPCSHIALQLVTDKFAEETEPTGLFAAVERVTLKMEAGAGDAPGSASTEFTLSHVRTPGEHEMVGQLVAPEHPLYAENAGPFLGAPLWLP